MGTLCTAAPSLPEIPGINRTDSVFQAESPRTDTSLAAREDKVSGEDEQEVAELLSQHDHIKRAVAKRVEERI